ncbi:MAG: hypothetical protein R2712_30020 [Vicinamibacterales bacterium]
MGAAGTPAAETLCRSSRWTHWPHVPTQWVLGLVSGIGIDSRDHIWILHRPRTVPDADRPRAAPPVLEFDVDGNFIQAWGGAGEGYGGPPSNTALPSTARTTSGLPEAPPPTGRSWKFTRDGKFLLQIGKSGASRGNTDTRNVRGAADVTSFDKTNEIFVADGYNNRRIIVFDASTGNSSGCGVRLETCRLDRHLHRTSARGNGLPPADTSLEGQGPINSTSCLRQNLERRLAVCRRPSQPTGSGVQAGRDLRHPGFHQPGPADEEFARWRSVRPPPERIGRWSHQRRHDCLPDRVFPDPEQPFLYVVDRVRQQIAILDRKTLGLLGHVGDGIGSAPGAFYILHDVAADSRGNLYTAEVNNDGNRRAQKFTFVGLSSSR